MREKQENIPVVKTSTRMVTLAVSPHSIGIEPQTYKISLPGYMELPNNDKDMPEFLEIIKVRDRALGTIWRTIAVYLSKTIKLGLEEERDFIKQAKMAWKKEFKPFSPLEILAKNPVSDNKEKMVEPTVRITILSEGLL